MISQKDVELSVEPCIGRSDSYDTNNKSKIKRMNTKVLKKEENEVKYINKEVKLFGAMTFFTTLVIVGMSIYVIHKNEIRHDGNKLVNENNEALTTAETVENVPMTFEALTADKLANLFQVDVQTDEDKWYGFKVLSYNRDEEAGIVILEGVGTRRLVISDGTAQPELDGLLYNYTHRDGRQLKAKRASSRAKVTSGGASWNSKVNGIPSAYHSSTGPFLKENCKATTSNCNCIKKEYQSSSKGCMKKPDLNMPEGGLGNYAYLNEDCSRKQCWNPSSNYRYKGNARYQADFGTGSDNDKSYEYKLSQFEALSCQGFSRTTGWGWFKKTHWNYKCVPQMQNPYRNGKSQCGCSWWNWGSCYDNRCGPNTQCVSTFGKKRCK